MSTNKFKVGDKVEYFGEKGTIIKIDVPVPDDNSDLGAMVEWDAALIPPQMPVPYRFLLFVGDSSSPNLPKGNQTLYSDLDDFFDGIGDLYHSDAINTQTHCPVCNTEWKETWIAGTKYLDCIPCGRKSEDILNSAPTHRSGA